MFVVTTCSHCGEDGYNKRGRPIRKVGLPPMLHERTTSRAILVDSSNDESDN